MSAEPWVTQTIEKFLENFGIRNFLPSESGVVTCQFEQTGRLTIRNEPDQLAVLLFRSCRFLSSEQMLRSLQLCHWDQRPKWQPSVGLLNEDQLFFGVSIPKSEFSQISLQQSFDYLCQLQDLTSRN